MRRGFTLVELLCLFVTLGVLASIAFPVFSAVKRNGTRTACISNLRSFGQAINLYRADEGGTEVGTPPQMGLPIRVSDLTGTASLRCHGEHTGGDVPGYHMTWPDSGDKTGGKAMADWASYTSRRGPASVLLYDPNHQGPEPRSYSWQTWTVQGLRLDGGVYTHSRLGYPFSKEWWHR
ncbi:type II secretion system protein [bacterium]|nr:MAG: type II secretion system protein [bacterium]